MGAAMLAVSAAASAASPWVAEFAASRTVVDLEREQGTWLSGRLDGAAGRARATAQWRVGTGEWKRMRIVKSSHGDPRVLAFVKASELPESGDVRLEARACLRDDCGEVASISVPLLPRLGWGANIDELTAESWERQWKSGADEGVSASGTALERGGFVLRGERPQSGEPGLAFVHARWSGTSLALEGTEGIAVRVVASGGGAAWAGLAAGPAPSDTSWVRLPAVEAPSWMFLGWSALRPAGMTAAALTSVTLAVDVPAGGSSAVEVSGLRMVVRGGEPWPHASRDLLRCTGVDGRFSHHPTRAVAKVVVHGEKERGCLVVPVTTLDGASAHLLVDTGASGCAFFRAAAERMGLASEKSTPVHDGISQEEVPVLRLDSLHVGPLLVDGVWMAVLDIDLQTDGPIDGIVAPSVLPEGLLTLDLEASTLTSEPGALPPADGITVFDLEWGADGAEVILPFAGEPTQFILDTGSTLAVTLGQDTIDELCLRSKLAEIDVATGALNDLLITGARVSGDLELGGIRVVDPVVDFQGEDRGLLGVQVLRHFVITLDYASRRVRLVPRASGDVRLPGVRLNGLLADRSEDGAGWIVGRVLRGTPAARKGLGRGEIIREVNGEDAAAITAARWEELQARSLVVVVESNGRVRRVRIDAVTLIP